MQILIALDGRSIPMELRRQATERSRHTGRDLVELHGWVTAADGELNRWLAATLPTLVDQVVRARDEGGEITGRWRVSWNSYAEDAGVHTYTLILHEYEELNLEALVVAGVELHPYEYREELAGEGLVICAKMEGSEDDVARLREHLRAGEIFPVVRHGIQAEAREMRLGVGEWSEFEDRVKYRVTLVEHDVTASEHPELARIERENSQAALGFYMNFVERLVSLLVERGVVSAQEIDAVREAASRERIGTRHDLWRVAADIDNM